METIAFYSYKGGAGRSLLLANAACYLVSLGRAVVALDLDLEAPGLHYKLGRMPGRAGGRDGLGGAVPYLVATARESTSPPSLAEHMIEITVPPSSDGWLRLMPAGPAPSQAYWSALKRLGELIRFDDLSGQGLMPLLDLHARIGEELRPDYLLIDARTGVTELGGLATTVLADSVVCMFVANQESLDGTLAVAEAMTVAPRFAGQQPVRLVPVLARATASPLEQGPFAAGVDRLLALSAKQEGGQKRRQPFILPHDQVHGATDRVVGDVETASTFSPLHRSYAKLFRELFPRKPVGAVKPEGISFGNASRRSTMAAKFEIKRAKDEQYYFHLRAGNHEIILVSEMYKAKASAENGIASVKKNAADDGRYERREGTGGRHHFVLKAGNHEIIGTSEPYNSKEAMENGIAAVKANAPDAQVVDLTA